MPTPHISAAKGDYADTVLFPGDPLRARYIAETFLTDAVEVTAVRSMLGFTGSYNGTRISVQGSGMGIPSAQIYATELAREYDVKRIVRVGSCGALQDHLALGDVVVGMAAGTDSAVNRRRFGDRDMAAVADWELLRAVATTAERQGTAVHVGPIFTSDSFYEPEGSDTFEVLARYGVLAVEMEAAGLYGVAASEGIAALTVITVSDHLKRDEAMSTEERQTSFETMITLVLDAVTAD